MVVCGQVDLEQVLLGRLDALADRLRNFLGLARTVADHALAGIADDHQRGERHVLAALDHLGDAIDRDHLVLQVEPVRVELFLHHCHMLSIFLAAPQLPAPARPKLNLEFQSSFAGCVGQRLHAAVIQIAAAIEDHLLDALLLRALGDQLAD